MSVNGAQAGKGKNYFRTFMSEAIHIEKGESK